MNGEVNTQNVRQYAPKRHPPAFNQFSCTPNSVGSSMRQRFDYWALLFGWECKWQYACLRSRMLNEFIFPQLAEHFNNQYWEGRFRGLWWAQDGAHAHRLIAVIDRLIDVFGNNRVIGG